MSVIRLESLLKTDSGQPLESIVRHAKKMDDLTTRLRSVLGSEASQHLLAANLRDDGELVLICRSPSWAARLRFESEVLLAAAADGGVKAERVRVRVTTGR
ncbi:MAG: DciA family protein [Woeseia sp.]